MSSQGSKQEKADNQVAKLEARELLNSLNDDEVASDDEDSDEDDSDVDTRSRDDAFYSDALHAFKGQTKLSGKEKRKRTISVICTRSFKPRLPSSSVGHGT